VPSRVFGLPTHILLVHAAVVLLPIAAILAVVVAVWPRARERFGLAVVGLAFVATVTVPLATRSGETLRSELPEKPLITRHVALGDQVLPIAALFGVALAGLVALDIYRRASSKRPLGRIEARLVGLLPRSARTAETGRLLVLTGRFLVAVVIVCSVLLTVAVIRAGDSGARAVWAHYPGLRAPGAGPG
jgi:hypothetical protein